MDDVLDRFRLRDQQQFINDVARQHPLTEGTTLMVLVHQPSRRQKVLAVRELPSLDQFTNHRGASDMLFDEVHRLAIPERTPDSASILVTVICRRGWNRWGPLEADWANAWRYSNHNSAAFDDDIFVVTENGWSSMFAEVGGSLPALVGGLDTPARSSRALDQRGSP